MNYQNLSLAFKRINADLPLLPYLQVICDGIADGKTNKQEVDKIKSYSGCYCKFISYAKNIFNKRRNISSGKI